MSDVVVDMNVQEQIARINQLQADAARKQQETRLAPLALVISAMTAGGGIVAATVALMKVLGP